METNNDNDRHLVAVYGSLLKGLGNHRLLDAHGARFVGCGRTVERFAMRDVAGYYPGIFEGGDTRIVVEVYEVDDECFDALDRLEGYPRYYGRRIVDVEFENLPAGVAHMATVAAWVYVMCDAFESGNLVASGNWREWKGAQA